MVESILTPRCGHSACLSSLRRRQDPTRLDHAASPLPSPVSGDLERANPPSDPAGWKGGQFRRLAPSRGMDAFILVSWSEEGPVLADPATVGYAWRLDELDPLEDNDEPDFDRNAYEQGLRWCTSFSCVTPEGENGWLADENLLPLSQDELDHARLELGRGSVPFWQVLDALFARAATRAI